MYPPGEHRSLHKGTHLQPVLGCLLRQQIGLVYGQNQKYLLCGLPETVLPRSSTPVPCLLPPPPLSYFIWRCWELYDYFSVTLAAGMCSRTLLNKISSMRRAHLAAAVTARHSGCDNVCKEL